MQNPATAHNYPQPSSLLEINQLSPADLHQLFSLADSYAAGNHPTATWPRDQILGSLFFQSSTRTRLGFESAAHRLGLKVISLPHILSSRSDSVHEESIQDAVRVAQQLVDIAVVRTSEARWYECIRSELQIPVINGGDGNNQHPTQALADLWFASRLKGDIWSLRVGLVGVLDSRVHRSVIELLTQLGPKEVGIFTEDTEVDASLAPLKAAGIDVTVHAGLAELLANSDVVEVMPFRMPNLASASPQAVGEKSPHAVRPYFWDGLRHQPLVLHPGPRHSELPDETIARANVPYFQQVRHAAFMKMAIFHFLLQVRK